MSAVIEEDCDQICVTGWIWNHDKGSIIIYGMGARTTRGGGEEFWTRREGGGEKFWTSRQGGRKFLDLVNIFLSP